MNTRARRAYPFYIFLPSSFLCASWHKFCCKPPLCKDNFLKRLRTFSSNFACHQASNVLTREEMALPSAHSILPQHGCAIRWHRSRPAVAQRNGFRPSPFALRLFLSLSLCLFDSLSFSLFDSLTLSLFDSLTLRLFDSLPLRLVCIMFLLYFCNWLECVTTF